MSPMEQLTCHQSTTIKETLHKIDQNARGMICFINEESRVIGMMTDGDIRRALLKGATLNTPVADFINRNFFWMPSGLAEEDYRRSIAEKGYNHVVVLDDEKRLARVISRKDVACLGIASISLAGNELKYVAECIRTNWISSQGEFVRRFEQIFAQYHGVPHAASCSNGTTAIHLALLGIGIEPGDEVIVPTSTFGATANAVMHAGGIPVFVDVEPDTWCISPSLVEQAITDKTKAIIPVHLYGHPADMPAIMDIAHKHGLKVIEDCAEALGAKINGRLVGTFGDVGCFSFFANKVITTGEGGMVISNDEAVNIRMMQYRDHGTSLQRKYWHEVPGYNYRMTNIQAAIGVGQMERLESFLNLRRNIAASYTRLLAGVDWLQLPICREGYENIYWLYTVCLKENALFSRDVLMAKLKEQHFDSRPFFPALHHQPAYSVVTRKGDFPVALMLEQNGLSLPTSNFISLLEVERICSAITRMLK